MISLFLILLITLLAIICLVILSSTLAEVMPVCYWKPDPSQEVFGTVACELIDRSNPYAAPASVELMTENVAAAREADFTLVGRVVMNRQRRLIKATVLVSPDRLILAELVEGHVHGVSVEHTGLYSHLANGTYLHTQTRKLSPDPSGILVIQTLEGADFAAALAHHRNRLPIETEQLDSFSEASALEEQNAIYMRVAERSIQLGLARYADSAETSWRYTLRGAFVILGALLIWPHHAFGVVRWKKSSSLSGEPDTR